MNKRNGTLIFWILYSIFMFMVFVVLTDLLEAFFRTFGIVTMQIIIFYLNLNFFIPRFFALKKYVSFGLINMIFLLFAVFVIDFLIRFSIYIEHLSKDHRYEMGSVFEYSDFGIDNLETIFNHAMPALLAVFLSFVFYNFSQQKKREEKEMLLVKAEKDFLISQINPHFLFNTLNNIYSLTLSNDNKGSKAILTLSKMLDYSLYSGKKERVSLREDILYINNFIELFKLKDDEINAVDFNYSDANTRVKIAPMLLIPFVENAFKHGNIEDINNGFINISLKTIQNTISFKCENSYVKKKSTDNSSGIGITNVKRRLELIYPKMHVLDIHNTKSKYSVSLSIDTKDEL